MTTDLVKTADALFSEMTEEELLAAHGKLSDRLDKVRWIAPYPRMTASHKHSPNLNTKENPNDRQI